MNSDNNKLMYAGLAALALIIIGSFFAYGVFDTYVTSTGFLEFNHPSFKSQEFPYPELDIGSVKAIGNELDIKTSADVENLKNPIAATSDSIRSGKRLYNTYCSACHGEQGDGQGLMGTVPALGTISDSEKNDLQNYLAGFVGYKPEISLNFFKEQPDVWLYYTITEGGDIIMPGFSDAMDPTQRWDLINYIKWGLRESGV